MALPTKGRQALLLGRLHSNTCLFCECQSTRRQIHSTPDMQRILQPRNQLRQTSRVSCPPLPFRSAVLTLHSKRKFSTGSSRRQGQPTKPETTRNPRSSKPIPTPDVLTTRGNKRPHIRAWDGELVPAPLSRPLGLTYPPQPGQNTGIDQRTWRERRDDFVSYDKHLERRKGLIQDLYEKNYFRDVGNLGKIHKGKSIVSPSSPYKKEVALYFPNLRGRTLVKTVKGDTEDITNVLRGQVSIVCLFNSHWGEEQTSTFVGGKNNKNPELQRFMARKDVKQVAQMVRINYEENWIKSWLVKMFFHRIRSSLPQSDWARYFLVRRGLSDEIREATGIWNMKVGYVYLVDAMCRVRWAGNGNAAEDERKNLLNCLARLVKEAKETPIPVGKTVKQSTARPPSRASHVTKEPAMVGATAA